MFITFFATGGAGSMLEEKEIGTWKRINSTPTKGYSILGGYILGNFLQGWIQVGMLIIVSRYIFNINWGNSTLGLIILFSSFLLAIIGLGAALSSFVKTRAQLSSLSSIVVMPSSLLAGCFWPRELMPDLMIRIADFVPQTWILKGMTDLVARGSEIGSILLPSLVLLIFAGVFFTVGLTFMSIQKES
jgi:ABC-2 type transport system permease protein